MSGYVAVYKCRLCGRKYYNTLLNEKEVKKCLWKFQNGKPYYKSVSTRNDVSMVSVHNCGDYCKGISDFYGFEPVGQNRK